MKTVNKFNLFLIGVIMLLLLTNFIKSKENNSLEANVAELVLEKQELEDSINNRDNKIIKLQEAVVFENEAGKKALSKYADSVFNLRKQDEKKYRTTLAYYQTYINTYIPDTIYVDYRDTSSTPNLDTAGLPEGIKEYVNNSVPVPRQFEKKEKYFEMEGIVGKNQVSITHLSLPDTLSGRFIEKKNGLFKAKTIEYQTFNTNPYIKIENSKSAIHKEKNDFLSKIIIASVFLLLGILIN